jgi:hypothetical protein
VLAERPLVAFGVLGDSAWRSGILSDGFWLSQRHEALDQPPAECVNVRHAGRRQGNPGRKVRSPLRRQRGRDLDVELQAVDAFAVPKGLMGIELAPS